MTRPVLMSALALLFASAAPIAYARSEAQFAPAPALPPQTAESSSGAASTRCAGQPTTSPLSRRKIIAAMRNRNDETRRLTLVAAHRGYWEDSPENSWDALVRAGFTCHFELVEADIKPALGGRPMVFHDLKLDRVSTGHGDLDQHTPEQLRRLSLRDRFGVPTSANVLEGTQLVDGWWTMLHEYGGAEGGPVMAFDVKARPDRPQDVWPQVEALYHDIQFRNHQFPGSLTNAFIFKIEARSLPADPEVIDRLIAGSDPELFHIIVVLNPQDSASTCALDVHDAACVVNKYKDKPYVVGHEVNLRRPGDVLEPILDGRLPGAIGGFVTYYDLPTGVGNSQAKCCSTLSTDTDAAVELDYRARWDWQATVPGANGSRAFRVITVDRPEILTDYLAALGLRDTSIIRR